ncbi:hypothetical protein [Streptomyces sp. SID4982]|uniref:hypothetical protein n=1 Tax=Streptomyces sp. SID4982 TaxID=2690291 RepID=UPI00136AF0C0|nr:hypothetical protein [Streptomyces sp. SID4982]MYS18334.1 hypothetical protein [Streptomyces sp. SID4982]
MSKRFTATQLAAAAALALVVGGTAGFFLAPEGAEAKAVSAESSCPEVGTSDSSSEAFGRIAGAGGDIRSTMSEKGSTPNSYYYSCSVDVDGKGRLLLTAQLTQSGSVSGWKRNLEQNGNIGATKDNKSFQLGKTGVGVASPFSAAVYLPCKPTGSKLSVKSNLAVEVTMLRKGGDAEANRSDAAQVARALAAHAQSGAHCEHAERLPAGPVEWAQS